MSAMGFNAQSQQLLCSRFTISRQWDRAWRAARDWLEKDPASALAHLTAGQALINLKRHAEAEPHLQKVLAAEPENSTAHRFLAIVQFEQKRYREADESIRQAIALDPEDCHHWYYLALMFYNQGDLPAARKYAGKARALNPCDPDIINLVALSSPPVLGHLQDRPEQLDRRLENFLQALEADPENAVAFNNLGVFYLNQARDTQKAEECFRQALFIDPTLEVARTNLFLALKGRDRLYRGMFAPMDFLCKGFEFMERNWRKNLMVASVLITALLLFGRATLAVMMLWFLLVWPMINVYEALTIGDIRALAGEIGARRGGFWRYHQWPLRVRLALFALVLVIFWTTVALAVIWLPLPALAHGKEWQVRFWLFILCGFLVVLGKLVKHLVRKKLLEYHTRRRSRLFDGVP